MRISAVMLSSTLTVFLSGCVTMDEVALDAKPASPELRKAIVTKARDVLFDPYSVRDAEISYLVDLPGQSDVVCVKLNAKNRMGGYTGRKVTAVYVQNGVPITAGANPRVCNNPKLNWVQFPEIEAL